MKIFSHAYGSPWYYASTLDDGVVFGICEYRTGLYRVYSAHTLADLQTGDGFLEDSFTSLQSAKADVKARIEQLNYKPIHTTYSEA